MMRAPNAVGWQSETPAYRARDSRPHGRNASLQRVFALACAARCTLAVRARRRSCVAMVHGTPSRGRTGRRGAAAAREHASCIALHACVCRLHPVNDRPLHILIIDESAARAAVLEEGLGGAGTVV